MNRDQGTRPCMEDFRYISSALARYVDSALSSHLIVADFLFHVDTGSYIALENEKLNKLHQELSSMSRKLEEMKQGLDSVWLFRD